MPKRVRKSKQAYSQFPIKVEENGDSLPTAIRLGPRWEAVVDVVSRKDIIEELAGDERAVKSYFEVTVGDSPQLTIFRNHVTGRWYRVDHYQ